MARVFGLSVSRSTVLRLVEALPDPDFPAPRVVGVHEYATRKGRHYGTVLVDVERRRPVDLLPDREASSLGAWLAKRPGIEVVCRDRAPFFAEGATVGAPQAMQVADRWHLWHNLSEAAERCAADDRGCLRVLASDPAQPAREPETIEDPPDSPWPRGHRFADRTRANTAPNSTPSPLTSGPLPRCSPSARANGRRSGWTPSGVTISPASTPSPQASNVTAMPSSLCSPCPGTPKSSKDTSTGSRCSNARCSAVPASLSCERGFSWPALPVG
ncbi:transposase [Streptomyces anulatus]